RLRTGAAREYFHPKTLGARTRRCALPQRSFALQRQRPRAHRGVLRPPRDSDFRSERSRLVSSVGRHSQSDHPRHLPVASVFRLLQIPRAALHDEIAARHSLAGDSAAHHALDFRRRVNVAFDENRAGVRANMTPFVVAVTATRNRPRELARLLASLEKVKGFEAAVIVDNGGDPETEKVVINARLKTCYFAPGENLGCGGGLALAEKTALEKFPALTHIWILDDDAVVSPDVLEILLREMQREAADIACPMIVDERGQV